MIHGYVGYVSCPNGMSFVGGMPKVSNTTPISPGETALEWVRTNWKIDPERGIIESAIRKTERPLGCKRPDGYWVVRISMYGLCRQVYTHNVIWWAYYGEWPTMMLDHKDRNKDNNSVHNLREASHSMQMKNRNLKGHPFWQPKGV